MRRWWTETTLRRKRETRRTKPRPREMRTKNWRKSVSFEYPWILERNGGHLWVWMINLRWYKAGNSEFTEFYHTLHLMTTFNQIQSLSHGRQTLGTWVLQTGRLSSSNNSASIQSEFLDSCTSNAYDKMIKFNMFWITSNIPSASPFLTYRPAQNRAKVSFDVRNIAFKKKAWSGIHLFFSIPDHALKCVLWNPKQPLAWCKSFARGLCLSSTKSAT